MFFASFCIRTKASPIDNLSFGRYNAMDVMHYFTGLVRFLIRQGRLVDSDPEIMAAQLCLPISAWINLCDREPERENDVMKLIERHIRQFFEVYQVK